MPSQQRQYQAKLVKDLEELSLKMRALETRVYTDGILMTAEEKVEYDRWMVRRRELFLAMGQEFTNLWYSTVGKQE